MPIQSFGRQRCRGLSLVELLIGLALGLFLVAGAVSVFVVQVGNSRRMLVEARINQDLRAAADLMTRDLRRAGYWGNAVQATLQTASPAHNPYAAIVSSVSGSTITYQFSRDSTENDTVDNNEHFGFRLNGGAIDMKTAGNAWQSLTDPKIVTVTALTITPTETTIDLRDTCERRCVGVTCPTITVRSYTLALTGRAVSDASIVRSLLSRVRVRNDQLAGSCPA